MGVGLLILCLLLAAVFGTFGFVRPDPRQPGVSSRNKGGAIIFLILALICLYSLLGDLAAPGRLAEYIPPYPGAVAAHVPSTGDGSLWWLLYTDDDPQAVGEFYRKEENRPGWTLKTGESVFLSLAKGDLEVEIFAARQHGETSISYRIHSKGD